MTITPIPASVKRVRFAAVLMFIGLLTELFSLFWHHPLAFVLFAGIGLFAMIVGLLVFLSTIFAPPVPPENGKS